MYEGSLATTLEKWIKITSVEIFHQSDGPRVPTEEQSGINADSTGSQSSKSHSTRAVSYGNVKLINSR